MFIGSGANGAAPDGDDDVIDAHDANTTMAEASKRFRIMSNSFIHPAHFHRP
jgi:hypothetical protein